MKCLCLWQPYASLIAIEAKRVETRHWPAPHWIIGQRVAIHATLTKRDLWMRVRSPFAAPIPFKARQGKFIDVPDELLGLPSVPRHEQGALL